MTVYLLGMRRCDNCEYVADELKAMGIASEKIVIDPNNEEHMRLTEEAKTSSYLEAPIICVKDADGTLEYVSAGRSTYALMKIKRRYSELVAA